MTRHDDAPAWLGGLLLLAVLGGCAIRCALWLAPLIQGVGQ